MRCEINFFYGLNSAESFTKTKCVKWHNLEKEKAPQKKMFVLENVTLIRSCTETKKQNAQASAHFFKSNKFSLRNIFSLLKVPWLFRVVQVASEFIDQFEINRKLNFEDGLSLLYYLKLVLVAIFLHTHVEVL